MLKNESNQYNFKIRNIKKNKILNIRKVVYLNILNQIKYIQEFQNHSNNFSFLFYSEFGIEIIYYV